MKIHFIALVLAAVLLASCGGTGDQATTDPTGATEERVPITIIDSIGVELGDSNYVFASIDALEFGPDGNIYVLDRGRSCVKVYGPDGTFIRQIAREGNGPGEVTSPFAMAVLGDGRISICSPFQGGILNFLPDGTWEGLSAEFTNNPPLGMVGADSNAYVALKLTVDFVDNELTTSFMIGRYEESDEPSALYCENSFPFDPEDLSELLMQTLFSQVYTADRQGNVYIAPYSTEAYEIRVLDRDGNELLAIHRDLPVVPKSPEEIQEEKAWMEAWLRSIGAQGVVIDFQPDPDRWQISDLGYDHLGRIWARRGTELQPVFDVFDGETGDLLFTAEVGTDAADAPFWDFVITDKGMLAFSQNPEYYQKVYIMELPE